MKKLYYQLHLSVLRLKFSTNELLLILSKVFILLLLILILSRCSLLYPDRTHIEEMDKDSDDLIVPGQDFPITSGDKNNGDRDKGAIEVRTPVNPKYIDEKRRKESLAGELSNLEEALTEREYQHYMTYKEELGSTSNKIFFLRLKGIRERNEYLISKGIFARSSNLSVKEDDAIRNKEIVLGMSKDAVIQSWGHPVRIDIAGDPSLENERWLFDNSYEGSQFIYFEKGRVRGWLNK